MLTLPRPASRVGDEPEAALRASATLWDAVHDSVELRPNRCATERARPAELDGRLAPHARAAEADRPRDDDGKAAWDSVARRGAHAEGFSSPPLELHARLTRRRPIGQAVETSISLNDSSAFAAGAAERAAERSPHRALGHESPAAWMDGGARASEVPSIERTRASSPAPTTRRQSLAGAAAERDDQHSNPSRFGFGTPPSAAREARASHGGEGVLSAWRARPSNYDAETVHSEPAREPSRAPYRAAPAASASSRAPARASDEKFASILSFLDRADGGVAAAGSALVEAPTPLRAPLQRRAPTEQRAAAAAEPAAGGASSAAELYSGVKAKMAALKQQLHDATARVAQLEHEAAAARHAGAALVAESEAAAARAADGARAEHESALSRHLGFIDRLLADKAELAKQVEAVQAHAATLEARFDAKLKAKDEALGRELKRRTDALGAAERARREQWMASKAKEIKELTIRGLEPDVQRLISKHRDEIRALADTHRAALQQAVADERAACARELAAGGARVDDAVAKAVARERLSGAEALERAREEAATASRAARKATLAELEEARELSEGARRREAARHDADLKDARAAAEAQVAAALATALAGKQGAHEALDAERAALRRDAERDKAAWLEAQSAALAAATRAAEEAAAASAAARRDEEVSRVIAKLSEEMARTKREIEADAARRATETVAGALHDADAARREAADASARAEQLRFLYDQVRDQLERTLAGVADAAAAHEQVLAERALQVCALPRTMHCRGPGPCARRVACPLHPPRDACRSSEHAPNRHAPSTRMSLIQPSRPLALSRSRHLRAARPPAQERALRSELQALSSGQHQTRAVREQLEQRAIASGAERALLGEQLREMRSAHGEAERVHAAELAELRAQHEGELARIEQRCAPSLLRRVASPPTAPDRVNAAARPTVLRARRVVGAILRKDEVIAQLTGRLNDVELMLNEHEDA